MIGHCDVDNESVVASREIVGRIVQVIRDISVAVPRLVTVHNIMMIDRVGPIRYICAINCVSCSYAPPFERGIYPVY